MKLYVRRMFIADEIDILPGYLRFVSGIVDSADLPLNLSRETIQENTILGAIRKGVTNRVISEIEKLADKEPERTPRCGRRSALSSRKGSTRTMSAAMGSTPVAASPAPRTPKAGAR